MLVRRLLTIVTFACALAGGAGAAEMPFLHPLFTDNAVVQRDVELPVWGWTKPGSTVRVSMGGRRDEAVASGTGKWTAYLGPFKAGGPHELRVVEAGGGSVTVRNVMAGDVWICSGQSNMAWGMWGVVNSKKEIAAADHPNVRLFTVPKKIAYEPEKAFQSSWKVCTPQSVSGFSAVGFFFGRHLNRELGVPIGLINTSWGGTVAEAWTSAEALRTMDDFRGAVDEFQKIVKAIKSSAYDYDAKMKEWWEKNDRGSKKGAEWFAAGLDDSSWKTMKLPTVWERAGLGNFDGLVWFRRSFDLPADWAGKDLELQLGPIDDADVTWLNGTQVGGVHNWRQPRVYKVPGKLVKAGRNVVAVRVLDTGGGGGIYGKPDQMKAARAGAAALSLAGEWRYRTAGSLGELSPMPKRLDQNPNVTTVLYNGMIAPLLPFAIKGAIWYQGESNAGRPYQYRRLMPTMIEDWRSRFEVGPFPFFMVQLANFMARTNEPVQSGWAELREAQLLTAQKDPFTGMAVIIDIGEANNIHPKNKQDVGRRLALAALEIAYQQDVVGSGPVYRSMKREGRRARLSFDYVGGGFVARTKGAKGEGAKGGELKGFAVAGRDGRFHHAKAVIDGDTILVSAPEVREPVAVRYGWANNPVCNLYNKEGLPATPFRTDVEDKQHP